MDNKELEHQFELFLIHKEALKILSRSIANLGTFTPPYIQMDSDNRLSEVRKIILTIISLISNNYPSEKKELEFIIGSLNYEQLLQAEFIIQKVLVKKDVSSISIGILANYSYSISEESQNRVKHLISSGDTEEALKELLHLELSATILNDVIIQSAKFEISKRNYLRGVITHQDNLSNINIINLAILDILKM